MPSLKGFQEQLRSFFRNPVIGSAVALSIICNATLWGILGWRIGSWPAVIPLHYTIYFSIDLIGPWYWLFGLPAIGLGVIITNCSIALGLFTKERINSYFLVVSCGLIQILLLVAGVAILNID